MCLETIPCGLHRRCSLISGIGGLLALALPLLARLNASEMLDTRIADLSNLTADEQNAMCRAEALPRYEMTGDRVKGRWVVANGA